MDVELDKLLAAKVMHIEYHEHNGVLWDDDTHYEHAQIWSPSQDIEAAFDLVNKLQEFTKVFYLAHKHYPSVPNKEWWTARFGIQKSANDTGSEEPTAALAICKAALTYMEQHYGN